MDIKRDHDDEMNLMFNDDPAKPAQTWRGLIKVLAICIVLLGVCWIALSYQ